MLRVGLTGGIGCGKSTVANLFSELGVPVIDTDIIAHQIMMPDGPAYQSVLDKFGYDCLSADQTIDRKKLASIVFKSKEQKQQLENILHPLIWLIAEQQINDTNYPYCVVVVPLLFEGSHQTRFNSTLVVDCAEEEQIKRVSIRDSRTKAEISAIMKNQIQRSERLSLADDIIYNLDTTDSLQTDIDTLHQKYIKLSQQPDN